MAESTFGTNDPRTQQVWSRALFEYGIKNMWFTQRGLMSQGPESAIQVDKDLVNKGAGDKVTFDMLVPLSSAGIGDDGTMRGNSEALNVQNMTVEIHERGHSVTAGGRISQHRTSTDIRRDGKVLLGQWLKQTLEDDVIAALTGVYNLTGSDGTIGTSADGDIDTVNESEPSTNRIWIGGQTAAGVVSAAATQTTAGLSTDITANAVTDYLFGTHVIELIKRKMKLATPKIRPLIIDGKEYYVALIHPYQAKALRGETRWPDVQKNANVRGTDNPIFSGALGIWDGVIIHELERIHMRTGAGATAVTEGFNLNAGRTATDDALASGHSAARALFLGAQAGVLGWGMMPKWEEDYADIGTRKPEVATNMLYGVKKTIFNAHGGTTAQEDFGTFVVETAVVPD